MGFFEDVRDTVNSNPIAAGLLLGPGLPVTTGLISAGQNLSGLGPKAPVANPHLERPVSLEDQYIAGNRSNEALLQQMNFANALQRGQGGMLGQSNVFGQQQALANQLQQQALGQGPNPALAQLAQQTSANTANQAALMAGQRGSRANAGMIARQAGQRGAANQQQMVGQAATMQAQQQLAAQQALAQQQAAMGSLATNQVAQQQAGLGMYGSAAQQQQQMMLNAIAAQNSNQLGQAGMQNQMNATNQAAQNQLMGNVINAGATGIGLMAGGPAGGAAGSMIGNRLTQSMGPSSGMPSGGQLNYANGGEVKPAPTMSKAASFFKNAIQMKDGGNVPGKASVAGNSIKNDKVPAMLSPGEIVIPRSITEGKHAAKKAAAFVEACLARRGS